MTWGLRRWRRRYDGKPVVRHRGRPLALTGHRDDVQGLRAVAVLLVVLDHAGVGFLKGGFIGVDVFFVLSGFLITGLLLSEAEKHGRVSLPDFYLRRARRILPAAALTLVVTVIAANHLLNVVRAKQAVWDTLWASFFAANIRFSELGTDYFARDQPPSPVQHYWSLAVEEQFYLVWPAILSLALFGALYGRRFRWGRHSAGITAWGVRRLSIVVVVAGAASLAWSIHYTNVLPTAAYFSAFTRVWELALGAALAIGASRITSIPSGARAFVGWLGVIAIGSAGVLFSDTTPFPGSAALLPTVGAALVIAAGIGSQPRMGVGRLLALGPMRYVGDRSYAFYLWHWPVLIIAAQYEGHDLSVGVKLLLLVGAFLLSIVSYGLVEDPIRRSRWSRPATATLWPASVAAVMVAAMFALGSIESKIFRMEVAAAAESAASAAHAKPRRTVAAAQSSRALPAVIAAVKAARREAKIPAGLTPAVTKLRDPQYGYIFPQGCTPQTDSQTSSNICRLGDVSSVKSIVVFGDSHAQMWMPTILTMAERDGWSVLPLVKSGCTPSLWLGQGYVSSKPATIRQCHAWYRWAARKAKELRPDVILMTGCCGGLSGSVASDVKRGFVSLANATKRSAKSVVYVADNDGIHQEPVDCLLARKATMRTCTTTATDEQFALNDDLAALAKLHGFGFLNTRGWFCFEHECPTVIGRTIAYRDLGHITLAYAQQLVPHFRADFRRCILDACPR